MIDNPSKQGEPSRAAQLIDLGALMIGSQRAGEVHTVTLCGELDLSTAGPVEQELERVEAGDASTIVIDLSGLTFISSSGIALLLSAQARSRADEGRLRVRRGSEAVQRVMTIAGVDELLPFAG
jgi:anti-sigma B factor antagonist